WDSSIRLWDATSGVLVRQLRGHTDTVLTAAFSPDGRRIVSGGSDSTVRLWDVESGKQIRQLSKVDVGSILQVAFSPDGKTILSPANMASENLSLWDANSGALIREFKDALESALFSPDGRSILAFAGREVRLWDIGTGALKRGFTGHVSVANAAAISPDGRTLLYGNYDRSLDLWDVASGRMIRQLAPETAA